MRTIAVALMYGSTIGTRPHSYLQLTQSTRTRLVETDRASHTGERFIDFAIVHTQPVGLVFQACAKLAPSHVVRGFGHGCFGKLATRDIAHHNQPGAVDNGGSGFVCPVFA